MIYLSIIIPTFNSAQTLPKLLRSISQERVKDLEVIVVDDCSEDSYKVIKSKSYKVQVYHLPKNHGPAYARNFGAKKARGKVLLFLDSDVLVASGTIKEVVKLFNEDKYRVAATGVWDKKQSSDKFFPKFKALRDWSYWINEKKADSYYYLFSTRIAAIRKDVFLSLGGFNEKYFGADVEDIEFTYRLAKKYRIDFDQNMRVYHDFEDFWPIAKKYFKRAYQWVEIFSNRKKFDPVATTGNEALTTLSAVGLLGGLGGVGILGMLAPRLGLRSDFGEGGSLGVVGFSVICILSLTIHLWGIRKFLHFVYKEEGIIFAIKSFFVGLALYCFIFGGAIFGFGRKLLRYFKF